jgi:hypothetical protein
MNITATCGHVLTEEEGLGTTLAIKGKDSDGSRYISHKTLCNKCVDWYRSKKLELPTEKDQNKWLGIKQNKDRFILLGRKDLNTIYTDKIENIHLEHFNLDVNKVNRANFICFVDNNIYKVFKDIHNITKIFRQES